ncbi:MAG: tyrosine-type recombinase/integrase [Candidatus Nanopelagicales bacterium]|jgi:integrase
MSTQTVLRLVEAPQQPTDPYDRIAAVLRPEFCADSFVPDMNDVALWGSHCTIEDCSGWNSNGVVALCAYHAHRLQYQRTSLSNRPGNSRGSDLTLETFLADASLHLGPIAANHPGYDFTGLPRKVELELRLLVQARSQNRQTRYRQIEHQKIRAAVLSAGLQSLIPDGLPVGDRWQRHAPIPPAFEATPGTVKAHVRFLVSLASDIGWPVPLMERDRWHVHDFDAPTSRSKTITWTGHPTPWVKDWVKRWVAHRLATGWTFTTATSNASRMLYFSRFLAQEYPQVRGPQDITRELLLSFLSWVRRHPDMAASQRLGIASVVRVLLEDHRLNDWTPRLPETAVLRVGELPRRVELLPRPIDKFVLDQILAPKNLAQARPDLCTALLILNGHGLRLGSVVELRIDCLGEDGDGFPTLRYRNTKRDRERLHPIRDPSVTAAIRDQQARARKKHPDTPWLFPRVTGNLTGERHSTTVALRAALREHFIKVNVVDRDGQPASVTPHQFRHTFGTRELNNGAPQEVVQELLDHEDAAMTRGYARLSGDRLRAEFIAAARFNAVGEQLETMLPDSPLSDVAWMKERLNRAKVSLPNGYCALPLQQTCEVQNACLDCTDYFVTTPEFIPEHEAQRARTMQLITGFESNGQERMAQKNRQVLVKLDTLLQSLRAAT